MSNFKMRVLWYEFDPSLNDEDERSLVSEDYYPGNLFFEDGFGDLVSSLEERHNVTLDHGGDTAFYELTLADDGSESHPADVMADVLEATVNWLDSRVS